MHFVEGLQRMLEFRDGTAYLRPVIDGLGRAIYQLLNQVDMFAIYSEVRCPLLLVNTAPADDSGLRYAEPSWISDLTKALRKGQTRDIATLAAGNLNVHLQTLKGSHGLLLSNQRLLSR